MLKNRSKKPQQPEQVPAQESAAAAIDDVAIVADARQIDHAAIVTDLQQQKANIELRFSQNQQQITALVNDQNILQKRHLEIRILLGEKPTEDAKPPE